MKDRDYGVDERVAGIFVPDTLLPSQYFDRIGRRIDDGEHRLLMAVLEDAVDIYRKQVGSRDVRGGELFREAEEWIESTDNTWLYSFENICDLLSIEPEYIRRGLRNLKQRAQGARVTMAVSHQDDAELQKASG